MEDIDGRLSALRRTIAATEEDVTRLQRKKAEHDDLEALTKRVSGVETDWREKSSSLSSELADLRRLINGLVRSVDHLAENLEKHKEEVSFPGIKAPSATLGDGLSVWERIPKWCYILMGMGALALVQQGPGLFLRAQGIAIPGVN